MQQWTKGREAPPYLDKPLGYSFFPNELFPVPGSWAGTLANLVHYKRHESGGHFAVSSGSLLVTIFETSAEKLDRRWKGRTSCSKTLRSGFQRLGRWAVERSSEFPMSF